MRHHRRCILLVAVAAAACAQQEGPPAPEQTREYLQALEQQARAIARQDGCDRLDQCATAPVGAKACGGPRTHLVYCRATTNEQELYRVLEELRLAEEAYIREAGIGSDCAFIGPPSVTLAGSSCVVATP